MIARWPLALAVVLHALLAVFIPPRFEFDSRAYAVQAVNMAAGLGSLDVNGQPETRYTPGYPFFVALFLMSGAGYAGAVAAQHALWVLMTAAAMWLGRRASGSMAVAMTAGIVTAVDLPALQSSMSILSETLAAATLMTAAICSWLTISAERSRQATGWALLAGMCGGATAIIRPIAVLLGVPLAIAVMWGSDTRWRARSMMVLVASFVLLPGWWTARNLRETGVPVLSSLAGINLLQYRAAATLAINDPGGVGSNLARRREQLERQACEELEAAYERPCGSIPWAQRSTTYSRIALPIILGDPLASARQAARAFGMIVLGGGAGLVSEFTGISERVARLVCLAYSVPLAVLAAAGVWFWWRRNAAFAVLLVCVIAYMLGMALGAEAYSRFRVPVIPLYGILCGGGVALLCERWLTSQSSCSTLKAIDG